LEVDVETWEVEAALAEFVGRGPHSETMRDFTPQLTEATGFVRWKIPGSQAPPSWDEALKQVESAKVR
jgi:hypothetical protein